MNSDEEDDRTVIRPPARTQNPASNVPPSHHATQHPATRALDATMTPPPVVTAGRTFARTEMSAQAPPAPPPSSSGQHSLTLPAGTRLGEFEVTQTIGEGGFGIVYLAWDHSLQRKVALKEYMPSAIASRVGATEIRPRSDRHQETFEAGLKSFINEARLLAQFDHPSLLKVYRFWEANGTAYMVMPFLEGATLRDTIRALPNPPDEDWVISLLTPLFDALTMLHAAQCYHRDIAPDNILLLGEGGRPLLLDFGAARRVIGDMTQALTAILKPGYAPVEQYAEVPGLKQGPWTDVYALAAVVHWMILGKTPSPSVGRMFDDAQVPLIERAAGRYSERFLAAIDRALVVLPDKRTQSIEAFRQDLTGASMPVPSVVTTMPGGVGAPGTAGAAIPPTHRSGFQPTVGPVTRTVLDEKTRVLTQPRARTVAHEAPAVDAAPAPPPPRRSMLPLAIGGALVVVAAVVAAVVLWPKPAPPVVPVTTPTTTPSTTATTTPATTTTVPATTTTPATTATTTVPATTTTGPTTTPGTTTIPGSTTATAPTTTTPTIETPTTTTTSLPPTTTTKPPRERPPVEKPPRERPPVERPPVQRPPVERPAASDNKEECGRLFQRLSLGEADQALMERIRTLRCR